MLLLAAVIAITIGIILFTASADVMEGKDFSPADISKGKGEETRTDGGDGGKSEKGGGGGAEGEDSSSTLLIPVTTTPPKVSRTTSPSPPKDPKSILLCTIGTGGILAAMIPPDGVCDLVFYTHVMCPNCHVEKRFTPIGDDTAYKALLGKANTYLMTTFGISLDQVSGEELDYRNVYEASAHAWQQNISHFGMLNIGNLNNYKAVTEGSMKQLKVFNDFLNSKRELRSGKLHVAVAAWSEPGHVASAPINLATAINLEGPFNFVTIVIVKSHVTHWQHSPGEIVAVGPNTMTNMSIPTQPTSFLIGQVLKGSHINHTNRHVMMSVTLGSAGFRMPNFWTGGIADIPVVHSLLPYPEACIKDIGPEMYTAVDMSKRKEDSAFHFLIMYDDHQLFKAKVEHFFRKYLNSSGAGIAAFDLEYEDFANVCGEGKFRRLKAIKDVVAANA